MKNIFNQIFIAEDSNEEPPSDENQPPSKMCSIEENCDIARLSCLFSGHNWSILYGRRKFDKHFLVIPAVRSLFLG